MTIQMAGVGLRCLLKRDGQMIAGARSRLRKVRAPQSMSPDNVRCGRPRGQCHRNVDRRWPVWAQARVQRWGKSPPARSRGLGQVNPDRCKVLEAAFSCRGCSSASRIPLEPPGDGGSRQMIVQNRTRLTAVSFRWKKREREKSAAKGQTLFKKTFNRLAIGRERVGRSLTVPTGHPQEAKALQQA